MFPPFAQFRARARLCAGLISFVAIAVLGFAPASRASLNQPPLLQVQNMAIDNAETKVFDVFAKDANHDQLTYGLGTLIAPDGSVQPLSALGASIASVDDAFGRHVGRVTLNSAGSNAGVWKLSVTVTDGQGGSDVRQVTISVGAATNRSPVFSSPFVDELFVFVGALISMPTAAADPDGGQSVALSAHNLPPGAVFSAATFSWTPPVGSAGDYIVYFDATDDGSPAITATRHIIVHVLDPGATEPKIVGLLPNEGVDAGGTNVTLFGQGFTADDHVFIGGNEVLNLVRINSMQVQFMTPAKTGVGDGVRDVTVSSPGSTYALRGGWLYLADTTPPAAPVLSIEDVNFANRAAVAFTISGESGAQAAYAISDGAGGSVTGSGTIGPGGTLAIALDLSGLADGTLTASATLADAFGNTSAPGTTTAIKDTASPVLTLPGNITVTATNSTGQVVTWFASAIDSRDGSLTPSCSPASGSLFAPGTTTVTCTATDAAGNSASGTFTISVVWSWSGLLSPIVDGGTYRLGRVLSLKFRLTGASAGVTNLAAHLTLYKISNGAAGTPIDADSAGNADSGNQFRYDASTGTYEFNLSTKNLSVGTWLLMIDFGDGTQRTATISLVR